VSILWTAQAEADLDAIHAFIARDSEHYASLQITRIVERVVHVASRPMSGHPVHEHPAADLREVHSGSYRIIYREAADQIIVVTVVHMKMRLPRRRLGGA
jgi:plasmid stabilization system protein ParE